LDELSGGLRFLLSDASKRIAPPSLGYRAW